MTDESQGNDITTEEQYNQTALVLKKRVSELEVVDQESRERMVSFMNTENDNIKSLKAHCKVQKDEANRVHKAICKKERELIEPHEENRDVAKRKIVEYDEKYNAEQERKAAEQAREQARLAEEARLAQAQALEAEGKKEQASAILEAPTPVAPVPQPKKQKLKGLKQTWYAEIVDENLIPREYMEPNMTALNAVARSFKDKCKVPGIIARKKW